MSINQPQTTHSTTDSTKSMKSNSQISGVSQRASQIANENRATRINNGNQTESTVEIKIPRSMQKQVRSLTSYLATSTEHLLNSSIQYVISYAKEKQIDVKKIKGYSQGKTYNSEMEKITEHIELNTNTFEELKRQDLLSEVSECAILGLEFLHLRLIELNRVG